MAVMIDFARMIPARVLRLGGIFAAILLLALMALLSFGAALRQSPTFDEVAHIGAGLSYVQKLDLRMNPEHPPLAKALAGLSLTLHGTKADYSGPAWTNSKDFMFAFLGEWSFGHWVISRWNNPATVLAWARFPMLLLTLALGWAIFICARRLGGMAAGLICLAVYVTAPIFLVFGPLVLTDIAIALFSVLTVWAFANMWREPKRASRWLFTLTLVGALLSKFSAPILLFGILISGLSARWVPVLDQPSGKAEGKAWRRLRWRATWKSLLWAALLVYAFYFVFSWNQPTVILERIGGNLPALVLRRWLFPLVAYLGGAVMVLFGFSRPSFLFGQVYPHGIWFYYPVVFALKSQLGFLGLLMISLILGLTRRRKGKATGRAIPPELQMHWRTIWVTLVVFIAVCMLSHFDISVRHFSVPAALVILLLATLPRMLEEMAGRRRTILFASWGVVAVLVLGCLVSAARTYPWYLPYVNALGAGKPAYTLMSDSNVDWNQALPEVEKFAQLHQLQDLPLDSYALSDDTAYVPQSHMWDCQAPTQADAGHWVVVSGNMILDGHNCSWLLRYPQEEIGGGSMYAFHLPAEVPPDGAPGGPPRAADRRAFLGTPFDFKALSLESLRYPERIPDLTKNFMTMAQSAKK
jgi:hypothetical protein